MRLRRMVVAVLAVLVVASTVAGLATGAFASLGRVVLGPGPQPPGLPSTRSSDTPAGPAPSAPAAARSPRAVLAADRQGPAPRPDVLAGRVAAAGRPPGTTSALVLDVEGGGPLFSANPTTGLIPASAMKVLTAAAVLSVLGPDHRFQTTVRQPAPGQVVLVGGGDPYLTRRQVDGLAADTAVALKRASVRAVRVGNDASLFSGPDWNSTWPSAYRSYVSPVSALAADQGRVTGRAIGPRYADPARAATDRFVAALRRAGIDVTGTAPAGAASTALAVASVESSPLAVLTQRMVSSSDNDAAEVLYRHVGLAGQGDGSFEGARQSLRAELTRLGAWREGAAVSDGSGLSRRTRLSAAGLTDVLRLAVGESQPRLRPLLSGLPTAGVDGSLRGRFLDERASPGRGLVRAKTGSLREVASLAGYVRTRDGSVLVFAFVLNGAEDPYAARGWLDRTTAALAACGCS